MSAFERRSKILDYLQTEKRASTRVLSEHFQVSEVTIRHDLAELAEQGWIARVHGGAAVVQQPEQPLATREATHIEEKIRIAQAAADRISPGDRLVLDSSTTAYQLALQLKSRSDLRPLTVVTNNLQVATVLAPSAGIEVLLIGGFIRAETWSAVGPTAEDMITGIHAMIGFFGAAGITLARGLTDADMREAQIKRAMIRAVDEIIVLVDSSKFGLESFSTTTKLENVHCVITDQGLAPEYLEAMRLLNLDIRVV